jgi:GTPase
MRNEKSLSFLSKGHSQTAVLVLIKKMMLFQHPTNIPSNNRCVHHLNLVRTPSRKPDTFSEHLRLESQGSISQLDEVFMERGIFHEHWARAAELILSGMSRRC